MKTRMGLSRDASVALRADRHLCQTLSMNIVRRTLDIDADTDTPRA